jgi:thiamine-monophosphate kinase
MKLSEAGELFLVDLIRKKFGRKSRGLLKGIGDDAAIVRCGGRYALLTTDMMVEGVHFDLRWTTPFQLGFKLVSVNVSDIYAMAGNPEYALLNFAAPPDFDLKMFRRFFDGMQKALDTYGVFLIGGDMSSADRLIVSATVTGTSARVVTRGGAKAGDGIYVTGCLGDAACGFEILKRAKKTVEIERRKKAELEPDWKTAYPLIKRHLMPEAVKPARFARRATAMIDLSDGLAVDLARLCRESGTGARVYAQDIPMSGELKRAAAFMGMSPLEMALGGGEDYELLFAAPPGERISGAFRIGEITQRGLTLVDESGRAGRISARGYRHFVS